MAPSPPSTISPYYIGAEWDANVPGHIEEVWPRVLNTTLDAISLTAAELRALALELWSWWRGYISADYPKPNRLVALDPSRSYAAVVDAFVYAGPTGSNAPEGFNRGTCLLIRGVVEPYPAAVARSSCWWLIQTWGHLPLVAGRRRFHKSEVAGVAGLLDFLDEHPYLWADRYGRKAISVPYVDVFSHPVLQAHYFEPTPPA